MHLFSASWSAIRTKGEPKTTKDLDVSWNPALIHGPKREADQTVDGKVVPDPLEYEN